MNNFIFIGGDLRSIYAAEYLNRTFDCCVYGFDKNGIEINVPVIREIQRRKSIVLPLPFSPDGANINAPYFSQKIPLSVIEDAAEDGAIVYTSRITPELVNICEKKALRLVNYFDREELAVLNAVPTAEGAIEITLAEMASTIFGSRILITGFGRIAKVLARYLLCMGAEVTVCARSCSDIANAEIVGCQTIRLSSPELTKQLSTFDVIFNTVPAQIFDNHQLMLIPKKSLIIDLATKSGIEDLELAKNAGVNVIRAMSLPGKTAPITAGQIIAKTILNIISEGAISNV